MKFSIRVKPNAKESRVEKLGTGEFLVWVRAPAQEGRANQAAIKALSEYFSLPKSRIMIIKGTHAKNKIVEVI